MLSKDQHSLLTVDYVSRGSPVVAISAIPRKLSAVAVYLAHYARGHNEVMQHPQTTPCHTQSDQVALRSHSTMSEWHKSLSNRWPSPGDLQLPRNLVFHIVRSDTLYNTARTECEEDLTHRRRLTIEVRDHPKAAGSKVQDVPYREWIVQVWSLTP